MKRSSSIFLTPTAWSVLVSLTAMLHRNCYDLFLPPAIWVQPSIPIELSCSSLWNNSPKSALSPSLAFVVVLCFFFRVSLFSVCGCWISHCEPCASPRPWNIPIRCGFISGQIAWVSSFQSGIVGTRCFPGSITIVFLSGGGFTVSLKGKMSSSHRNCLGLFQRLGKTDLQKIWRLPSLLLLLVLWAGGGVVSWNSCTSLCEGIILWSEVTQSVQSFPDSVFWAVGLQGAGYCMLLCYPEVWYPSAHPHLLVYLLLLLPSSSSSSLG